MGPRRQRGRAGLVHLLSPFDPLVIQRKRTELFFDYGHRFEAYVPKEKRLFGYFALPVLVGDDIVAAIDLKTDRQNKKLLMQKWSWVGKGAARPRARTTSAASRKSCIVSSGFSWRSRELAAGLHREPFAGGMPVLRPARASCIASGDDPR